MEKKNGHSYLNIHFKIKKEYVFISLQAIFFIASIVYLVATNNLMQSTLNDSARLFLINRLNLGAAGAYYLLYHLELFIVAFLIIYFPPLLIKIIFVKINYYLLLAVSSIVFYAIHIANLDIGGVSFLSMVYYMPVFFSNLFANMILTTLFSTLFYTLVGKKVISKQM